MRYKICDELIPIADGDAFGIGLEEVMTHEGKVRGGSYTNREFMYFKVVYPSKTLMRILRYEVEIICLWP